MSPRDDRDIRAALSADRPQRTTAELEAAARRLLKSSTLRPSLYRRGGFHPQHGNWKVFRGDNGWGFEVDCVNSRIGLLAEWTDGYPTALSAASDLLRHHPELWPEEPAESDTMREAAREALEGR